MVFNRTFAKASQKSRWTKLFSEKSLQCCLYHVKMASSYEKKKKTVAIAAAVPISLFRIWRVNCIGIQEQRKKRHKTTSGIQCERRIHKRDKCINAKPKNHLHLFFVVFVVAVLSLRWSEWKTVVVARLSTPHCSRARSKRSTPRLRPGSGLGSVGHLFSLAETAH